MSTRLQIRTIESMPFAENTYVVWLPPRKEAPMPEPLPVLPTSIQYCRRLRCKEMFIDTGEPFDIAVGNVPAILAQMRGDAVRSRLCGHPCGPHRIGMTAAARIADGRDVIDVDAEAEGAGRHSRTQTRTTASASNSLS